MQSSRKPRLRGGNSRSPDAPRAGSGLRDRAMIGRKVTREEFNADLGDLNATEFAAAAPLALFSVSSFLHAGTVPIPPKPSSEPVQAEGSREGARAPRVRQFGGRTLAGKPLGFGYAGGFLLIDFTLIRLPVASSGSACVESFPVTLKRSGGNPGCLNAPGIRRDSPGGARRGLWRLLASVRGWRRRTGRAGGRS